MFQKRFVRFAACSAVLLSLLAASPSAPTCQAETFYNTLSLQGFTGVLNTPNAAVTGEGRFDALYSDQRDSSSPTRLAHEDSFMALVGLFKYLELGGRFSEAYAPPGVKGGMRDISANAKLQIPFLPQGPYLPQLAVGIEDFAGGVHHLRSGYLVGSEELWRLRLSVGYGTGPDRMKGAFGGAELMACDWFYLLADYDTKYPNLGARLVLPELFGIPVRLQATVKDSPDRSAGGLAFGVGLQFPLGADYQNRQPAKEKGEERATTAAPADAAAVAEPAGKGELSPSVKELLPGVKENLSRLRELLAEEGFQNLSLGAGAGGVLVVEYENERYNHNELDGLGVVAGLVCRLEWGEYQTLRLVMKKKGIRMVQLAVPIAELRAFLADAGRLERFKQSLAITDELSGEGEVSFLEGESNPSWLRPSLVLYPELRTFVGTEFSPFDYLLSLKPDLFLPLWKGAVAEARWNIPVSWSRGFDEGQPFRDMRLGAVMDRAMLFQAVKLSPGLMANLGAGMVQHQVYGTLDELFWSPAGSVHRLGFRYGYGDDSDTSTQFRSYLGSYRYLYAPLDLYLEGTGGRFWGGDTGFELDVKRFFGDTAVSFYYKRVEQVNHQLVQAIGVQFSFPLTPRRDMNPSIVQVKGSNAWSYAQESEVGNVPGHNVVGLSIATVPEPYYNLTDVFYNRDRLSESYLREHLLRLRDACLSYVEGR